MEHLRGDLEEKRSFEAGPCLPRRSRGGLWVTSWAAENPEKAASLHDRT